MTNQTNTAAFWLDVANVCEQAYAAAQAWKTLPENSPIRDAMLSVSHYAESLRMKAMHLRNAIAMEEAADASR